MNRQIALWPDVPPAFDESLNQAAPSMTLYPVSGARGVVLVLPGGGYDHKAAHEGAPIAERLNRGGIAAAVLDYRVSPYRAPVPQWDAMRAVQHLRSLAPEYGWQADHVAILGFSAGGHLAASVTYKEIGLPELPGDPLIRLNPCPDAAVLCYPVITLGEYTHLGTRNSLLGQNAPSEQLQAWSIENCVRPGAQPAFIWHTSDDGAVPVQNSLLLASALAAQQIPFSLHIWPHGHHGLGLAEEMPDVSRWLELAVEWLHGIGY